MTQVERISMIRAVEEPQLRQRDVVENNIWSLLSINRSDELYQSIRFKTTLGLEIGSLIAAGYGAVKGITGFTKLARVPVQYSRIIKPISHLRSKNPLIGTKYTKKVLFQMEKNLKTGKPDFHGFLKIVDNYAGLGTKEILKGKDGITRIKISLDGSCNGIDGSFE